MIGPLGPHTPPTKPPAPPAPPAPKPMTYEHWCAYLGFVDQDGRLLMDRFWAAIALPEGL
jgi:hypothetical protein